MGTDPKKRLFLRGDDAGLSVATNQAIEQAILHGALRNVSIMAGGLAWEDAAERFKNIPGISLGLHVALNCEWNQPRWGSILPGNLVPDLVEEDGTLTRTPMVLHERKADVEQMMAEAVAGLARLRSKGVPVGYLDEHMGIGWVNGFGQRLDELAAKEGIFRMSGLKHLKLPEMDGSKLSRVEAALREAEPGDYLMVFHPDQGASFSNLIRSEMDVNAIAAEREGDRQFLTDPELPETMRRIGVEICRFADLANR
jgi:predicted glycoside hydrolase/deacetylase ChbG (UPF0249 family)